MIDRNMAPWDELTWLSLPVETTFNQTQSSTVPVANANPMRIGLLFRFGTAGGTIFISTKPSPSGTSGFQISIQEGFELNSHDNPGLVQAAWYANIPAGAGTLCVIETLLRDWPRVYNGEAARIAKAVEESNKSDNSCN